MGCVQHSSSTGTLFLFYFCFNSDEWLLNQSQAAQSEGDEKRVV